MRVTTFELADVLNDAGLNKTQSAMFLKEIFNTLKEGLEQDGIVKVSGFGTFSVVDVKTRKSVDVNTKETFVIPAHKKINFVASRGVQEMMNQKYSNLKVEILPEEELKEENLSWFEKLKKIFG